MNRSRSAGRMSRDAPRHLIEAIAVAAVAVVVLHWSVLPTRVDGQSMAPTLLSGDIPLANRIAPRLHPPARGDVVVVADPDGDLVKRVIGLPGDLVAIVPRWREPGDPAGPAPALFLRPAGALFWVRADEPYLGGRWAAAVPCCSDRGTDATLPHAYRVPEGRLFVLGDNRDLSRDSRSFGPVAVSQVSARIDASLLPPHGLGPPMRLVPTAYSG